MNNIEILRDLKHTFSDGGVLFNFSNVLENALEEHSLFRALCKPESLETDYLLEGLRNSQAELVLLSLWKKYKSELDTLLPVVSMVLSANGYGNPDRLENLITFWMEVQLKDDLKIELIAPANLVENGSLLLDELSCLFPKGIRDRDIEENCPYFGGIPLRRGYKATTKVCGGVVLLLESGLIEDTEEQNRRITNAYEEISANSIRTMEILYNVQPSSTLYSVLWENLQNYAQQNSEWFEDFLLETVEMNGRIFPEVSEEFYEEYPDEDYKEVIRLWYQEQLANMWSNPEEFQKYVKIVMDQWFHNPENSHYLSEWWDFLLDNISPELQDLLDTQAAQDLNYNDPDEYYEEEYATVYDSGYTISILFEKQLENKTFYF